MRLYAVVVSLSYVCLRLCLVRLVWLIHYRVYSCRMRCSVVCIAWSHRVMKRPSSACVTLSWLLNSCPSKPRSYKSSNVSSSCSSSLRAAILTRWKNSNCWRSIRIWSAVALLEARSIVQLTSSSSSFVVGNGWTGKLCNVPTSEYPAVAYMLGQSFVWGFPRVAGKRTGTACLVWANGCIT